MQTVCGSSPTAGYVLPFYGLLYSIILKWHNHKNTINNIFNICNQLSTNFLPNNCSLSHLCISYNIFTHLFKYLVFLGKTFQYIFNCTASIVLAFLGIIFARRPCPHYLNLTTTNDATISKCFFRVCFIVLIDDLSQFWTQIRLYFSVIC